MAGLRERAHFGEGPALEASMEGASAEAFTAVGSEEVSMVVAEGGDSRTR